MKWCSFVVLASAIAFSACKPPPPKNPVADTTPGGAPAAPNLAASAAVPDYNIGDVEFATIPAIILGAQSHIPSIQYSEMRNPLTKAITAANAVVSSPLPDHLYVTSGIVSERGYRAEDTVVIRVSIKLDSKKDPIATKSYVFSGKQLNRQGVSFDVDLIPHLDPKPESVLVQAWLKIIWFPNSDPSTIDPDTVDDSKGQTAEKLSNPFRIDFK